MRNVSANGRRYHAAFDFDPWTACRINDLGDVPLPEPGDNERSVERISASSGDRSGPAPDLCRSAAIMVSRELIVQAIAGKDARLTGGAKTALLHLDAHTDAYENLDHWLRAKKSAANWAAYLVRQGNVDPSRSVQIGMRGNPRGRNWLQLSYDLGYEVITMERYRSLGPDGAIEIIQERIGGWTGLHHLRSRLPRSFGGSRSLEYRTRRDRLEHG